MSVLVINSFAATADDRQLQVVAGRIGDLVNQARTSKRPVAHLHQKRSQTDLGLRVSIDRFEPVFLSGDIAHTVPEGLFEFILRSPTETIQLVGVGSSNQFARIRELIRAAGFFGEVEPTAVVSTHE